MKNSILDNIRQRTEAEIKAAEGQIELELKAFEEDLKWQLTGVRTITERDMKAHAERTRYALETLQKDVISRAKAIEETTEVMFEQHKLWRKMTQWRFTLTPMAVAALAVLIGSTLAFLVAPRQIETRVEIQPPRTGLEGSYRVMALGGAGTVLVLPESVAVRPCPLRTPADRVCVRAPRTRE